MLPTFASNSFIDLSCANNAGVAHKSVLITQMKLCICSFALFSSRLRRHHERFMSGASCVNESTGPSDIEVAASYALHVPSPVSPPDLARDSSYRLKPPSELHKQVFTTGLHPGTTPRNRSSPQHLPRTEGSDQHLRYLSPSKKKALHRDIDLNCTPAPFDLNCPFGEDPVVQDGTNELINEKTSEGQFAQATTENKPVVVSEEFFERTSRRLEDAVPTRGDYRKTRPTIYKVPRELKKGYEEEGYEPVAVRIGPFKYTDGWSSTVQQLENYKWCCVRQLLLSRPKSSGHLRCSTSTDSGQLKLLLKSMKRLEPVIRASYSEEIEPACSDGLALKMLLDGCFILHRLMKYARIAEREAQGGQQQQRLEKDNDDDWTQVFGRVWVWQLVASDLLLLENQIPFSVLLNIFEHLQSTTDKDDAQVLVKGSLQLFHSLCPQMPQREAKEIDFHNVHHLLHLLYLSLLPKPKPNLSDHDSNKQDNGPAVEIDVSPQWIPCAKELEEAGVRFKKRKDTTSFLDINFDIHSGVLEIPPLQLYDSSDKLFRNLIAFEQTYPGTRYDISTYAIFMDCLINTPEDMRILHLRGILVNQINGESDASRFFNRICSQVLWSNKNYLKDLMLEVNKYSGSRLHKWRAQLVRNYFSNPWVAMSVVAAVLLLGMTILQTTFTVYPYFKPPK
ncbi:UPF0481 protein At3g47200 isoform X3 [Brachypodium distachyon]|uniref:UPF0481 protein At3g47200 isoform X3 n=1 Tax=Brachypodium distachyon TaxID=15368 RepID=UPI000D0E2FD3|nr:UPF0481 protein At3g47200 isoform X3 [Brachypodium distachyon]|eukprot:XP_024318822.1 UPF0481 protein At3g47200 isoform X3 [Brachypodium distachyon]